MPKSLKSSVRMSDVRIGLKKHSWKCHDCDELLTSKLMDPISLTERVMAIKAFEELDKDAFYALIPSDRFLIGTKKSSKRGGKKYTETDEVDWDNVYFLCAECDKEKSERKAITIRIRPRDYKRLQNKANGNVSAYIVTLVENSLNNSKKQ
jgi:hypothetical protein